MCARFVHFDGRVIQDDFGAVPLPHMEPHYNIAPTDPVIAVLERDGARRAWPLQWGLVPSWAKDPSSGSRLINARAETVAEKPSFRGALKYRRCVIPADGFYEWKGPAGKKQPYYIHRRDGRTMAFAGLWETWERAEGYLETCTIITTAANREMSELHDRMPVILELDEIGLWLDRSLTDSSRVMPLLNPAADGTLDFYEVDRRMSNPRAEGPELIARKAPDTLF